MLTLAIVSLKSSRANGDLRHGPLLSEAGVKGGEVNLVLRLSMRANSITIHAATWLAPLVRHALVPIMLSVLGLACPGSRAQPVDVTAQQMTPPTTEGAGTSTDLFVMFGSDFDRPGLLPRANYNVGIGHTFGFLKKDPIGDELTFGYTYENAGSHGFLHTRFGEDTESAGVMKNFGLPGTKIVTGYTWLQSGITSYTGNARVQNRLDSGVSIGAIVHCSMKNSIWIQESYSKVVTVPWYTTTSIGYTLSW